MGVSQCCNWGDFASLGQGLEVMASPSWPPSPEADFPPLALDGSASLTEPGLLRGTWG